jgi:hypothetical protein
VCLRKSRKKEVLSAEVEDKNESEEKKDEALETVTAKAE